MKRLLRLFLVLVLAVTALPLSGASAQQQRTDLDTCQALGAALGVTAYSGTLAPIPNAVFGAEYCMLVPPGWGAPGHNDLVVVAHGYVPLNPLDPTPRIPWDQYIRADAQGNTLNLPGIITGLGYAFATTSYSKNGLAVLEGVADTMNLVQNFPLITGLVPQRTFLAGVSEGGAVTALAVEQHPDLFSGGLATCGPIGDFRGQINYWGDFRTVLDYFFPTLFLKPLAALSPSTAIFVPENVMQAWVDPSGALKNAVSAAVLDNKLKTTQLLSVSRAPIDPLNARVTIPETVNGILDYNLLATDEGRMELAGMLLPMNILETTNKGNPYSNIGKRYSGSFNDNALNKGVKRYQADPDALAALQLYQTSGKLTSPLVVMHTTGDPIVPYWHATQYVKKAYAQNNLSKLTLIPVMRYGHCAFTQGEAVFAFYTMILKATAYEMSASQLEPVLPDQKAKDDFKKMHDKQKKDPIKEIDLSEEDAP